MDLYKRHESKTNLMTDGRAGKRKDASYILFDTLKDPSQKIILPFFSDCFRFPSQRHSDGSRYTLVPRARLQRKRELRPLQNHSSNMYLRQQRHLLLRPCSGAVTLQSTEARAGQTSPAHLRNPVPNEQRSAAEVRPVSDFSPPHRSVAYRTETGWRDSVSELWNQPGPRWERARACVYVCSTYKWMCTLIVWWR